MRAFLPVAEARMVFNQFHVMMMALGTISARLCCDNDPQMGAVGRRLAQIRESLLIHQWPMRETEVSDYLVESLIDEALSDEDGLATLSLFHQNVVALSQVLAALSGQGEDAVSIDIAEHQETLEELREAKRLNLELLAYEAVAGRVRLKSMPVRHVIDAGSRCNLRCLTCHQSATQDLIHYDIADVPTGVLAPAIRLASLVQIAGMGETLLSRASPKLVEAYSKGGVFVELLNNGTLLSRAVRLVHDVDMLSISVDGGTEETYNAIRRWGDFRKLMEEVGALSVEVRRKICFNFVVCKQNLFSCLDIVREAILLQIGQVHFQEMNVPLSWHSRMALDEVDRQWFFNNYPQWRNEASDGGVFVIANLMPSQPGSGAAAESVSTVDRIAAVGNVPIPPMPRRMSASAAMTALESFAAFAFPPRMSTYLARLAAPSEETRTAPREIRDDVAEARAGLEYQIDAGTAKIPHCLASYAQLLVNGDGSTRSCCSVQSQLSTLFVDDFDQVRNSRPYMDLRSAHASQVSPRRECEGCRDPLRYFLLIDILREMKDRGVDIARIARPDDFDVPVSLAENPLVQELGSALR